MSSKSCFKYGRFLDNITPSARQKLIQEMAAHPGDKPSDEERESIKEKHSKLTKELYEVRSKVHHIEKEIKAVQKEILQAGCNLCLYIFLVKTILSEGCTVGNNHQDFLNNDWSLGIPTYLTAHRNV